MRHRVTTATVWMNGFKKMATMLTTDEFHQEIHSLLAPLSAEQLRAVLQRWAEDTHPRQRQAFVERLRHHCLVEEEPAAFTPVDRDTLSLRLAEMQTRLDAIARAEPEWGDVDDDEGCGPFEPVMADLFDLLDAAATFLHEADSQAARETYEAIWAMVDIENEYGHSPRLEEIDDAIAREHVALYLRAVYLSTPPAQRVEEMLEAASGVGFSGSVSAFTARFCSLREIAGAASPPLPDWTAFLDRLVGGLQVPQSLLELAWLREALANRQGLEGIASMARRVGVKFPRLWLDWVGGAIRQGDLSQAAVAWQEAQAHFSRGAGIWHEFADCFQEDLRWLELPEAAAIAFEALLAKPGPEWVLALHDASPEGSTRHRRLREAAAWLALVAQQGGLDDGGVSRTPVVAAGAPSDRLASADQWLVRPSSFAPWGAIAVLAWCLTGEVQRAKALLPSRPDSLGWSLGDSPSWSLFACLPTLLAARPVAEVGPASHAMWRQLVAAHPGDRGSVMADRLNQAMRMAVQQSPLPPEEAKAWLLWCCETATERCHAIVAGQHRKAYPRAAACVALCRETAIAMGRPAEGERLVLQVRQHYPRHTAFQRALDEALSGLGSAGGQG